jgi:hypothetical protein
MTEEKDNKEDEKEVEEKKRAQEKSQKDAVKTFLIVMAGIVGVFAIFFFIFYSANHFEYRGVKFAKVNMDGLIFYKTAFRTGSGSNNTVIRYLRNDPRELNDSVSFNGELSVMENVMLNFEDDFNCNGDGPAAIGNLDVTTRPFGIHIYTNQNATCDPAGGYTYIQLQNSNETSIEQIGPSCYEFNINNCEIIPVTERFILEMFIRIQEIIDSH